MYDKLTCIKTQFPYKNNLLKPLDNDFGLGACILPEAISHDTIKILSIIGNLNKATHILGPQLNF